jgi:hypothetical protein
MLLLLTIFWQLLGQQKNTKQMYWHKNQDK